MQDSIEIKKAKIFVNGAEVTETKTFLTEYGEVYIGLFHDGKWMNVHSSDLKKYLSKNFFPGVYQNSELKQ
jgi:hypothetical protein